MIAQTAPAHIATPQSLLRISIPIPFPTKPSAYLLSEFLLEDPSEKTVKTG